MRLILSQPSEPCCGATFRTLQPSNRVAATEFAVKAKYSIHACICPKKWAHINNASRIIEHNWPFIRCSSMELNFHNKRRHWTRHLACPQSANGGNKLAMVGRVKVRSAIKWQTERQDQMIDAITRMLNYWFLLAACCVAREQTRLKRTIRCQDLCRESFNQDISTICKNSAPHRSSVIQDFASQLEKFKPLGILHGWSRLGSLNPCPQNKASSITCLINPQWKNKQTSSVLKFLSEI